MRIINILYITLFTLVVISNTTCVQAQQKDSIDSKKEIIPDSLKPKHSPKMATIMSACLPGLGQIYNKKYWKVPVIYAGLGTLGYFLITNRQYYLEFKKAYQYRTDGDSTTIDKYANTTATPDQLKQYRDYYRSNLELTVILTTGLYLINIIDATVDAHLFNFDVSDKLALNWTPYIHTDNYAYKGNCYGLSLKLNIK